MRNFEFFLNRFFSLDRSCDYNGKGSRGIRRNNSLDGTSYNALIRRPTKSRDFITIEIEHHTSRISFCAQCMRAKLISTTERVLMYSSSVLDCPRSATSSPSSTAKKKFDRLLPSTSAAPSYCWPWGGFEMR
jgi:hypothetical protein